MYFAVLGRHPQLSLAEFALVPTSSMRRQGSIVLFETELDQPAVLGLLEKLGGIVKRGTVVKSEDDEEKNPEVVDFLAGVELIGVNSQKLGMTLKRTYGVRRFKEIEITSSDLEVKQEGKEIVDLGGGRIGLVLGRQDIAHFELIDFGKPASGMEVGMMPAKLTQILINIGLSKLGIPNGEPKTIYDPLCGFGTTGFVANRLGHHFIGSDIVIVGAKENAKWRKENEKLHELHFTIFKHDVTQVFDHPVVKNVDLIMTEGRLGPVIGTKTRLPELKVHSEKIVALYTSFLHNIHQAIPTVPIVMTVPSYARLPQLMADEITRVATGIGYVVEDLGVYSRPKQEVHRHVLVLSTK